MLPADNQSDEEHAMSAESPLPEGPKEPAPQAVPIEEAGPATTQVPPAELPADVFAPVQHSTEELPDINPHLFHNVIAFDPAKAGSVAHGGLSLGLPTPPPHKPGDPLPPHVAAMVEKIRQHQEQQASKLALHARVTPRDGTTPSYFPTGLYIDWIDPTNQINVQIVRKADNLVYDQPSTSFKAEGSATNSGLIALAKDTSSTLRAAYQFVSIPTPNTVFTDGIYRIFYYGAANALLDVCSFGVYGGCPFPEGMVPVTVAATTDDIGNLIPSPAASVLPPVRT